MRPPQVAADVALSCAVVDGWEGASITHHKGFFREGPGRPECECHDICTYGFGGDHAPEDQIMSYHHIPGEQIENLFNDHKSAHETGFAKADIWCPGGDHHFCNGGERVVNF